MSDVIKRGFVSFNEQKKAIKVVTSDDPRILSSTGSVTEPQSHDESSVDVGGEDQQASGLDSVLGREVDTEEINRQIEEAVHKGYQEGFDQGKLDGQEAGYQEGLQTGQAEMDQKIHQLDAQNQTTLDGLKQQLMEEFQSYKTALEPKMLGIIESLVIKLVGELSASPSTIMHLIRCGLDELEIHGDLVIKVSQEDLDYVIERKAALTEELSEKIKVEILKDQQLEKNEVVIETEMGTIESSLGVQMEGLIRELRLIKESLTSGE